MIPPVVCLLPEIHDTPVVLERFISLSRLLECLAEPGNSQKPCKIVAVGGSDDTWRREQPLRLRLARDAGLDRALDGEPGKVVRTVIQVVTQEQLCLAEVDPRQPLQVTTRRRGEWILRFQGFVNDVVFPPASSPSQCVEGRISS
jgi:hypothetical protein